MNLDNAKRASKIKVLAMLFPLLVVVAVALSYLLTEVKDLKYVLMAVVSLLVYFIVMAGLRLNFIAFYAGPDKIRIRYKSLLPFKTNNNSVQMKTDNFHHYQIKESFGGLVKTLTLYQTTPGGVGKYPNIGISTLNNEQLTQIIKALDLILALKKNPHS
ncbi:MAG: hypothetical protein AB7E36_14445 [Salinivirgaceae bacterium]